MSRASASRSAQTPVRIFFPRIGFVQASALIAVALLLASWVFVLSQDRTQAAAFFSAETFGRVRDFAELLLGIGTASTPAFLRGEAWSETWPLAYRTLAMGVLGIGFAGLVALATFMLGARNLMTGELSGNGSRAWGATFVAVRGLFVVTRGVPELIWAMLIVFAFSPGILPGAIALAIHNSGILGKLAAEVVEGMDPRPIRALRTAGAGRAQVLLYGVLPQALPRFLTLLMYRWEVIIRTTIVVGFVAAGGLGEEFRLSMSHFHYTTVTLIVLWYLGLVVFVDLVAAGLRRLAR